MHIGDVITALKNALSDEQAEQFHTWTKHAREELTRRHGSNLPTVVHQEIQLRFLAYLHGGAINKAVLADPVNYEQMITDGLTAERYRALRATEAARQQLAAEQAKVIDIPTPTGLAEFIEQALNEDETWRIEELWGGLGRILLAAQYKAGKTTLIANLIRSLVDGEPFLSQFQTTPVTGKAPYLTGVLLIDTEMTTRQLGQWFHAQGITNKNAVEVLTLRGQLSGFNILTPEGRQQWARQIEGAEIVILDNLRPVLDALGLDENREAGRFLTAWDEFMAEMNVKESLIVTHTGHSGERARGDSALLASNDGMWTLVRQDPEDLASPRYFKAYGRGFDQPETLLHYDRATGRLRLGTGNRKTAFAAHRLDDVITRLGTGPGTSQRGLREAIPGDQKMTSEALKLGMERGLVEQRKRQGQGGGHAYYLTEAGESYFAEITHKSNRGEP